MFASTSNGVVADCRPPWELAHPSDEGGEGLAGSFFRPLIQAYVLAILASLVVALTVTPALCLILLRNAPPDSRESPLTVWLKRGYERLLRPMTRAQLHSMAASRSYVITASEKEQARIHREMDALFDDLGIGGEGDDLGAIDLPYVTRAFRAVRD